jgi:hypothetical protein
MNAQASVVNQAIGWEWLAPGVGQPQRDAAGRAQDEAEHADGAELPAA